MLIPCKKITIKSTLEPSQIEENLKELIGLEQYTLNPFAREKPYYGHTCQSYFHMRRVRTIVKNDFAPVIDGTIEQKNNQTIVKSTMKFRISVLISWILALSFFAFGAINVRSSAANSLKIATVLIYLIPIIIFNVGVFTATKHLQVATTKS